MIEQLQDDELAKADIKDQARLEAERSSWESEFREIDELYPHGAGGFDKLTPGAPRGETLFDPSHLNSLERFAAAGVEITTPEHQQYIRPKFLDPELMKDREVQLWCQNAGERIYAVRHALHTGFGTAANEDWDQLGRYGTSPMWCDVHPSGRGLFYRTLHLSACWIDTGFNGLVDRVNRKWCLSAAQAHAFFGADAISPKMAKALEEKKPDTEFEILHLVAPNTSWDRDTLDHRRFPVASRYLALDEKVYLRRKGYNSMPVAVSRHTTSAGEKYGRSPALKMKPTTRGLQAMQKTILRSAHKAVDPALLFYNDDGITKLVTRPAGLNPGLMSEDGRPLVGRMPGGEAALPFAEHAADRERAVQGTAFLEEFYKILTDPNSRMTTTEVLEVMAKQGVLVRPFASRYASEKQHPISQRELDLLLRNGQLPPLPAAALEAGAWPQVEYENPMAMMARAQSTGKTLRFLEALNPLMQIDQGIVDYIDTDELVPGIAAEIGVKPQYVRDKTAVAALRQARQESEAAPVEAESVAKLAGAYLDTAKANQISEAA